jgi:hypothetical protein
MDHYVLYLTGRRDERPCGVSVEKQWLSQSHTDQGWLPGLVPGWISCGTLREGSMTDSPERLAERLLSEGEKTVRFFRELAPEDWERAVYTEGTTWTVLQVLAHIVAAEDSMARLVRDIQSGGAGTPEGFDLDRYNARKVDSLQAVPPAELLELFAERRRASAAMALEMCAEDLAKKGRHPYLGVAPIVDIVKLMYLHNGIHLRDIRKLID